jgi:hypothetical protein
MNTHIRKTPLDRRGPASCGPRLPPRSSGPWSPSPRAASLLPLLPLLPGPPPPPVAESYYGEPAEVVVNQEPPPPYAEVVGVAPAPGYIWVGGYWHWYGNRWVWYRGHYMRPPHAGAVWVAPRYVFRNGTRIYVRGYWR